MTTPTGEFERTPGGAVLMDGIRLRGETIEFRAGETIHTENSYKYSIETFSALARGAGWMPLAVWTDAAKNFSIHVLKL